MASIFLMMLFYSILQLHGLVLKKHSGDLITRYDLGPFHQHHHIHKYFCDTLYPKSIYPKVDASTDPIINVVDYGADPTGIKDSTSAFKSALIEALSRGAPNVSLSDGIHDCGGATIYLGGGDYLISETLHIPPYYGNLRITDGTIRANSNFSSSSYMILVGSETENCTTKQKSCNEYINIDHLFCDCRQICFGCIHIVSGMSSNIGPQVFFLGYNSAGITTTGGHSLFLLNAWFGEYLYSDPRKNNYTASTATSINLNNPDNLINDVIVYSSRVGVNITGPASVLTNVHTWNLNSKLGGIGIVLYQNAHTRLINSYLDHNDLVLYTPIKLVSIQNTFFLGSGTLRLVTHNNNGIIDGLSVVNSQYSSGNGTINTIELDETNFKFAQPSNVYIIRTFILDGYNFKSTRVSKKLTQIMTNKWDFDFTNELLFTSNVGIENHMWIDYTFQFDVVENGSDYKDTIVHWVNMPNKGHVYVETNKPTNATVYVTVDESYNSQY